MLQKLNVQVNAIIQKDRRKSEPADYLHAWKSSTTEFFPNNNPSHEKSFETISQIVSSQQKNLLMGVNTLLNVNN